MIKIIIRGTSQAIKNTPSSIDEKYFNLFVEQKELFYLINNRLNEYFRCDNGIR